MFTVICCMFGGIGFGYYSLSSIFITEYKGTELGTIALLSNIVREMITLLLSPLLVKVAGPLAPIAAGGVLECRTSSGQAQDKFHTDNPNITTLIRIVGDRELSVKEMMECIRLTGRDNFLKVYLTPSISAGFIRPLYPNSPRHPRQKYLLTAKGMMILQALVKKGE